MADTPDMHFREPLQSVTPSGDEAAVFDDIVRQMGRLPDGIRRVEFHLGEDSEGSPAVWITFVAHDDLNPSKEKLSELRRVTNEVRSQVIQSGTKRWPYIEIATE